MSRIWQGWIELHELQVICRHFLSSAASILSYKGLASMVEWGIGPGLFRVVVESIDRVVLVVLLFIFLVRMLYRSWQELGRNAADE